MTSRSLGLYVLVIATSLIGSVPLVEAKSKAITTVAAFDDKFKEFLAKVKTAKKAKDILVCGGPIVLKDPISKFGEISFSDGCSISIDVGDILNTPFVALAADTWRFSDAGVAKYRVAFAAPPSSLVGPTGAKGGDAVSYSRDNHVPGGGHDGSPGAPGGPGGLGNIFDRPASLVLLVSKGIFDKTHQLKTEEIAKLNVSIDASGVAGGQGGKGGNGGRGGDGEGGIDGLPGVSHCHGGECTPEDPPCRRNAGPGGIGGTGGIGGKGGQGADGGHAADVGLYAAETATAGMAKWKISLSGGDMGKAGEPGNPGAPGLPGDNGRVCGPSGTGRAGSAPTPPDLGTFGPGIKKGIDGKLSLHPGL